MTEYRGRGLFLNLKLDPSPFCLNELQRNKLTTSCTVLIESNEVTRKWVTTPILCHDNVFNVNSIASVMAELSQR